MKKKIIISVILLALCTVLSFAHADGISLSLPSGFYAEPQNLTVHCDIEDAVIRYTLDGTRPNISCTDYSEPIELPFTTNKADPLSHIVGTHVEDEYVCPDDLPSAIIVRAAAFLPDGSLVEETCGTYFIGYDRRKLFGDLPVISLMMDSRDLFDMDHGIYVLGNTFKNWVEERGGESYEAWQVQGNFSQRGKEWERPVMVDFMMSETDIFFQNMGVRIKGGTSRTGQQKSLRLIARDEYGAKSIKHDLFPNNLQEVSGEPVARYKSVVLRNGGNDRNHSKLRDPFISDLARGLRMDISENRFVIAFINGEYWGLYALNEDFSDNYIQYHYGIDDKNIILIKNEKIESGEEEDFALYTDLLEKILDSDPEDPDDYAELNNMLDMDSLADYLALTLYIDNQDDIFKANNFEMWRVRETSTEPYADGKWRIMLFDTDYSSGVYTNGEDFNFDTVNARLNDFSLDDNSPAWMVLMLLDNENFRAKAINAMCDIRNLFFERIRMNTLLSDWRKAYLPMIKDTFRRFGPEWIARWSLDHHPASCVNSISTYFAGRYGCFLPFVQKHFGLDMPKNITLRGMQDNGTILLNGRNIPLKNDTQVQYFSEFPLTVTAVPNDGKIFSGWEISGNAELDDPTATTATVTFSGDFTLVPLFN